MRWWRGIVVKAFKDSIEHHHPVSVRMDAMFGAVKLRPVVFVRRVFGTGRSEAFFECICARDAHPGSVMLTCLTVYEIRREV
jgi:hypothetical protein